MKKEFSFYAEKLRKSIKPVAERIASLFFDDEGGSHTESASSAGTRRESNPSAEDKKSADMKNMLMPKQTENANIPADPFSIPISPDTPVIDRCAESITELCSKLKATGGMLSSAVSTDGSFSEICSKLNEYDKQIRVVCGNIVQKSKDDPSAPYLGYDLANSLMDIFRGCIYSGVLPRLRHLTAKGHPGSESLAKSVNTYLSSVGFYTPSGIASGIRYDKVKEYMNYSVYYCSDSSNNGIIKEIENLPYIIRFIGTRGEQQELVAMGTAKVYKYIEG